MSLLLTTTAVLSGYGNNSATKTVEDTSSDTEGEVVDAFMISAGSANGRVQVFGGQPSEIAAVTTL